MPHSILARVSAGYTDQLTFNFLFFNWLIHNDVLMHTRVDHLGYHNTKKFSFNYE